MQKLKIYRNNNVKRLVTQRGLGEGAFYCVIGSLKKTEKKRRVNAAIISPI